MVLLALFFSALIALPVHGIAQQSAPAGHSAQDLRPGELISKVVCSAHVDQSYALYLPSYYTSGRRWPIVFVFDPLARGSVPVELMKDAAERYGFIVAGSNNSRNGPWKVEIEAAQAMSEDTQGRLRSIRGEFILRGYRAGRDLRRRWRNVAGVWLGYF